MAWHESGEARVIPVILRSVDWQEAPFAKLQALPQDAKPVANWESRDDAFTSVVQGVRQAIKDLSAVSQKSRPQKIIELFKRFALRPKKFAGQEFVADVILEDVASKIDEQEADVFNLPLGDAISRRFVIKPEMSYADRLYADGKLADWLEDAPAATYRLRLRLIYGTYEKMHFNGEKKTHPKGGFRLMEVIEANSDATVEKAQTRRSTGVADHRGF